MSPTSKKTSAPAPRVAPGGIVHAITLCKDREEIHAFCRNPQNLARISKQPVTIVRQDGEAFTIERSDDDTRIPVEILGDEDGRRIAWRSTEGSFPHEGSIELVDAPGDEGTELIVRIYHQAAGGKIGGALSRQIQSSPASPIADALRRLKALLEAGEIPTIDGQPVGEPQKSKRKK